MYVICCVWNLFTSIWFIIKKRFKLKFSYNIPSFEGSIPLLLQSYRVLGENMGKMGSGWSQGRGWRSRWGIGRNATGNRLQRQATSATTFANVCCRTCVCGWGWVVLFVGWWQVGGKEASFWVGHKQLFVVCLTVGPVFSCPPPDFPPGVRTSWCPEKFTTF